jgi:hypothetical protein
MCGLATFAFALGSAAPRLSDVRSGNDTVVLPADALPPSLEEWSPATSRGPPMKA